MTRRGSLVFYLAAVVVGCFCLTVALWLGGILGTYSLASELHGVPGFLRLYFLGLIFGTFYAVLFAWLLRRLMTRFKCTSAWQWISVGAILPTVLIWVLGSFERIPWVRASVVGLFLAGPSAITQFGGWQAIPAGTATAYVLYLIHRAFEPLAE